MKEKNKIVVYLGNEAIEIKGEEYDILKSNKSNKN